MQKSFAKRGFAAKYELPPLPYEISGLEPVISGNLMDFHYNKHHKTYVTNLNNLAGAAEEALAKNDIAKYAAASQAVKFNFGGAWNHTFFWDSLAPKAANGGQRPDQGTEIGKKLNESFGSYDNFVAQFNAQTAAIQGSGWGWLVYDKGSKSVRYQASFNQDLITDVAPNAVPLLTIDIWEHAYYLDYKNVRPDFLKSIWEVVNWEKVEHRLKEAQKA